MTRGSSASTLLILAGLPGVGKSTLARRVAARLKAVHLRIDSIERALAESSLRIAPAADAGYRAAYGLAADNLVLGRSVVADSVNPVEETRTAWRAVAREAGCAAVEIEVICSDIAEHRRRVETRHRAAPEAGLPTWEAVLTCDYRPWTRARVVVDTAGRSAESGVAAILGALPSRA